MSEPAALSATIDGLNRLLSDTLNPELERQEVALEAFLAHARQAREKLRAAVDHAEAELTPPLHAAEDGLQRIEDVLDATVVSAREPATTPIAELFLAEAGKSQTGVDHTRQQFEGILAALGDAYSASKTATAEGARGIEELTRLVAEACGSLEEAVQLTVERLDGARERIDEAVASIEEGLGELQQLIGQRLDDLQSRADATMLENDETITRVHEDTRKALEDLCAGAGEILNALAEAGRKISELFDGEAGKILDKVQELLKIIEQIRPLLEVVKQWT